MKTSKELFVRESEVKLFQGEGGLHATGVEIKKFREEDPDLYKATLSNLNGCLVPEAVSGVALAYETYKRNGEESRLTLGRFVTQSLDGCLAGGRAIECNLPPSVWFDVGIRAFLVARYEQINNTDLPERPTV